MQIRLFTIIAATLLFIFSGNAQASERNSASQIQSNKKVASTGKTDRVKKQKFLVHETRLKKQNQDSSRLDLSEALIRGERKSPSVTMIRNGKTENSYNFVWVRQKWHPEMLVSAGSLGVGNPAK